MLVLLQVVQVFKAVASVADTHVITDLASALDISRADTSAV